jgi:hypothetical protein
MEFPEQMFLSRVVPRTAGAFVRQAARFGSTASHSTSSVTAQAATDAASRFRFGTNVMRDNGTRPLYLFVLDPMFLITLIPSATLLVSKQRTIVICQLLLNLFMFYFRILLESILFVLVCTKSQTIMYISAESEDAPPEWFPACECLLLFFHVSSCFVCLSANSYIVFLFFSILRN